MRAACCTLPAAVASAPGFSGRGSRSDGVAARAMRAPHSPPSSPVAAVGVGVIGGSLDLFRLRPLAAAAAAARSASFSSPSRFRPRVPPARRRRQLRPLSSEPRATPEDDGDDEEGAPSTSSSSLNENPDAVDVEVEKTTEKNSKQQQPKKATPVGDLIALISPARKREAGGPPPPTLSKRLRAIRGSLRAVVEDAWRRTLTLPGFSHAAAALRALDALTRPGRELVRDTWLDVNERFEMFRVEEAKQRWAWESRSKEQGIAWKRFCDDCVCFLAAVPYLVLCPSHPFFSCFLPLLVGLVAFDHPLLNGVTLAWVAAMLAGKLRRGLLSGLVGLPPGFSGL